MRALDTAATQVPDHLAAVTQTWTSQITSLIGPQGPGYFHYASVGNSPVLLGMRVGQLSTEHLAAMFMKQHAPGKRATWWAPIKWSIGTLRVLSHAGNPALM